MKIQVVRVQRPGRTGLTVGPALQVGSRVFQAKPSTEELTVTHADVPGLRIDRISEAEAQETDLAWISEFAATLTAETAKQLQPDAPDLVDQDDEGEVVKPEVEPADAVQPVIIEDVASEITPLGDGTPFDAAAIAEGSELVEGAKVIAERNKEEKKKKKKKKKEEDSGPSESNDTDRQRNANPPNTTDVSEDSDVTDDNDSPAA